MDLSIPHLIILFRYWKVPDTNFQQTRTTRNNKKCRRCVENFTCIFHSKMSEIMTVTEIFSWISLDTIHKQLWKAESDDAFIKVPWELHAFSNSTRLNTLRTRVFAIWTKIRISRNTLSLYDSSTEPFKWSTEDMSQLWI